jgi:hypothetical protein
MHRWLREDKTVERLTDRQMDEDIFVHTIRWTEKLTG